MPVLCWDRPEKIMSVPEWEALQGAAPAARDAVSASRHTVWSAELKRVRTGHPQVEIRKFAGGSQLLLIVALDGWKYGTHETREGGRWGRATAGQHVRLSANGVTTWTFDEFADLAQAVKEARQVLQKITDSGHHLFPLPEAPATTVTAEDVAAFRRDYFVALESATDEELMAALADAPELVASARAWGWDDTVVRDGIARHLEQHEIAVPG